MIRFSRNILCVFIYINVPNAYGSAFESLVFENGVYEANMRFLTKAEDRHLMFLILLHLPHL